MLREHFPAVSLNLTHDLDLIFDNKDLDSAEANQHA